MTMIVSSTVMENITQCLLNMSLAAQMISSRPEVVTFATATASLICAFTILANATVVLSMSLSHCAAKGRRSRGHDDSRISEVLMTSMASTDVIIGTCVMPLSISELAGNGEWPLGSVACSLRVVLDVVCCTLSIYHVVAMAVDRYLAVCWPWVYRSLTPRTAYVIIVVCWTIPLLLVSAPILAGFHHLASDDVMRCALVSGACVHSFSSSFLLLSFSVSFYIPIATTLVLYSLITWKICKRCMAWSRSGSNRVQPGSSSEVTSCVTPVINLDPLTRDRILRHTEAQTDATSRYRSYKDNDETVAAAVNKRKSTVFSFDKQSLFGVSEDVRDHTSRCIDKGETPALTVWNTHQDKIKLRLRTFRTRRREAMASGDKTRVALKSMKSVRTIGLVVLCFVVSWIPFSIMTPLVYFRSAWFSSWSMRLVSWMGYANSAWNPILFCCNRTVRRSVLSFKRGKLRFLCPGCK